MLILLIVYYSFLSLLQEEQKTSKGILREATLESLLLIL